MFIILGAAGNVGSEVVRKLTSAGQKVIAVVHSPSKADALCSGAVEPVVVDLADSEALRPVLRRGTRAFLLNPPGDPGGDSNAQELATARSITNALAGSGLEKIVVTSTYGARQGDSIGDLSTLYTFEQLAIASGIPAAINRGAYYFTNLDMLAGAAAEGSLPTAFPSDFPLPMVAAPDLGAFAAKRLMSSLDDTGVVHIEGPERYTFADVAAAFAKHLGREVKLATTPREQWEESFRSVGFSKASARSFARMTAATIDAPDMPDAPLRGQVSLDEYVANLVAG